VILIFRVCVCGQTRIRFEDFMEKRIRGNKNRAFGFLMKTKLQSDGTSMPRQLCCGVCRRNV